MLPRSAEPGEGTSPAPAPAAPRSVPSLLLLAAAWVEPCTALAEGKEQLSRSGIVGHRN